MNETFKMDNITIELDEDGYLVNSSNPNLIKRLEEENLYLKAELEYSKKLRAVVQARKNQQQKKK